MTTASDGSALVGPQPLYAAGARSWHPARRLRSVVGQLSAFMWGDGRLSLPAPGAAVDVPASPDDRRRAEMARLAGPVAADAHLVPVPPAPVDKHSAVAHYRAMAEQVARERRVTVVGPAVPFGGRA